MKGPHEPASNRCPANEVQAADKPEVSESMTLLKTIEWDRELEGAELSAQTKDAWWSQS